MDIPVSRVDDYTLSLIQEDVARFFPNPHLPVEPEASEDDSDVEVKVVRRGRPPKPKANEDVETK